MTRFYSILHVLDPEDSANKGTYIVCETAHDEKTVILNAERLGLVVTNTVAAEDAGNGIFLNLFTS